VRQPGRVTALLGVLIAVLAACSNTASEVSGSGPDGARSATPPFSSSAPTTWDVTAEQARLQQIMITAADVPTDWSAQPATGKTNEAADSLNLAKCLGVKDTYPDQVASVDSQEFTSGEFQVSSHANSFSSESDIDIDASAFSKPQFAQCEEALVPQDAGPGTTATITVTPGPAPTRANQVATGSANVHGPSASATVYSVFIRGPRAEVEVDFVTTSTRAFPADLRQKLADVVAHRAATS